VSLRLFLSADLAGSTAFKQKQSGEVWQRFFAGFYSQLPAFVNQFFQPDAPKLSLWKTIGDEVVFSAELGSSSEVPAMVDAFRKGVAAYREKIRKTPGDLDLKCAAWTAGFPVGNLAVELPGEGQWDYIGPGMDIGFRLVKEASPRRMPLSVELAYILTFSGRDNPDIVVGRSLELKGVGKGRRYPCLWLDCFQGNDCSGWDHLELEEESLRHVPRASADPEKINAYCRSWLEHMGPPFLIPFIEGDALIGEQPQGYVEMLEKIEIRTQEPQPGSKEEDEAAENGTISLSLEEFAPEVIATDET